MAALSVGSLVAGRYEITAPIATGGMGEVWKARDRVLDRTVAAKVLKSEFTGDPSFLARFRNEARHTAALTHPNIASVYDYGETEQEGQRLAFLVMEFVDGQPLVSILHDEGRLPVDWTLHVLGQAADGLSAAHRAGVVHRDIKPGNLMVRPDGVVKLTDFGIAQARDATPLTRTGMVVGTAQYLSPEQAQGFEVTAASDVYSLGVVGYECLVGRRPFDGASQVAIALAHINRPPPPLPGEVPRAVRELIERALAKDPADRFADGGSFAEAIRAVAAAGSVAPAAAAGAVGAASGATTEVIAQIAEDGTRVLSPATAAAAAAGTARTSAGRTMPPLQGPPVTGEDEGYGPPVEEDERRRRPRWLWPAVALVLLLLLGTGLWFALSGEDADTGGTATSPTATTLPTTAAATTIPLDASDYIGRDADEVAQELEALGLQVNRRSADDALLEQLGVPLDPGDVAGLEPTGTTVPVGSQVVLFVAEDGYSPDDGAQQQETEPTTVEREPTEQAPPQTSSPPAERTGNSGNDGDTDTGNGEAPANQPGNQSGQSGGNAPPQGNLPGNPAPEENPDGPQGDDQGTGPTTSPAASSPAGAAAPAGAAGRNG